MPLPTSRNTTYAPQSQIKSADLNDIQDKIIDAHFGVHGERTMYIPASSGLGLSQAQAYTVVNGVVELPSSSNWIIPVPLRKRDRLLGVRLRAKDGSSGSQFVTAALFRTEDGVAQQLGDLIQSDGSGTWQDLDVGGSAETVEDGQQYYVMVSTLGGPSTGTIQGLSVDYDHPA